jgi:hypothetical protein
LSNTLLIILLSSTLGITVVVGFPFTASLESPCASEATGASFRPRTVEPQPPAYEQYTRELDNCQYGFYACQATSYPMITPVECRCQHPRTSLYECSSDDHVHDNSRRKNKQYQSENSPYPEELSEPTCVGDLHL